MARVNQNQTPPRTRNQTRIDTERDRQYTSTTSNNNISAFNQAQSNNASFISNTSSSSTLDIQTLTSSPREPMSDFVIHNKYLLQPPPAPTKKRTYDIFADRFIPTTNKINFQCALASPPKSSPIYTKVLKNAIGGVSNSSIVDYSPTKSNNPNTSTSLNQFVHQTRQTKSRLKKFFAQRPIRVLDIPDVIDDYYTSLLDWSIRRIVAVALTNQIYLWNDKTETVNQLYSILLPNYFTCIEFTKDGQMLCAGDLQGKLYLFDTSLEFGNHDYGALITTFQPDDIFPVTCIAFNSNQELAVGTINGTIMLYYLKDVKQRRLRISPFRVWKSYHQQRIITIEWDSGDKPGLASSSADKTVIVWQAQAFKPKHIFKLQSVSRGIAFCPNKRSILVVGCDEGIKVFNCDSGLLIRSKPMETKILGIKWAKNQDLIVSLDRKENQLIIVGFPLLEEIGTIPGHSQRLLFMAMDPTGLLLCTASGDENLKFWKVFEETKKLTGYSFESPMAR